MLLNQISGTRPARSLRWCFQSCVVRRSVFACRIRTCRATFALVVSASTRLAVCIRCRHRDDDTCMQDLGSYYLEKLCTLEAQPDPIQAKEHRRLCSTKLRTRWSTKLTSNRKCVSAFCFPVSLFPSTSPQASAVPPQRLACCCIIWRSALLRLHLRRFLPPGLFLLSNLLGSPISQVRCFWGGYLQALRLLWPDCC